MTETPDPSWLRHVGGVVGDPDQFGLRIETVSLPDGSGLTLPGPGVTAIVGANNSGKSTLLRQMNVEIQGPGMVTQDAARLLAGVELARRGSGADFAAWVARHAAYREQHGRAIRPCSSATIMP